MSSITIDRQDGLSSAVAVKGPCRVVAVSNIALTGLQTIDGISLAAGDRVLARGQSTATENGIYVVDTGPWRRAVDFAGNRDVKQGTQIYVSQGTTYSASGWYVATANPIVIGTTALTISQNIMLNAAQLIALEASATAAANTAIAAAAAASAALAGLVPSFQTVASAQITVVPALITVGRMLGYYTAGDCPEFLVKRVDAQPTHALRFRGVDRYKADGVTVDNANGGWWEFQLPNTIDIMQCGAFKNSNTDSAPAVQAAVAYIESKYGWGSVFFPPNGRAWIIASTVENAVAPITYYGINRDTAIHCGPNDITIFKLTKSHSALKSLTIYGKGISTLNLADNTFGASAPTVRIPSGSVATLIDDCYIAGGANAVRWEGGDCKIYRSEMTFGYEPNTGLVYILNGGSGWMHRCATDQAWPVTAGGPGYQTLPSTVDAWAPATPYNVGDVRVTQSYVVICKVAGTSGASAPNLKNYSIDIPDGVGTLVWRLVSPDSYGCVTFNTGAVEVDILQFDMTAPYQYGIKVVNTNPLGVMTPVAPRYITVNKGVISQTRQGGVFLQQGSQFFMADCHDSGGGSCAGSASVVIGGAFGAGVFIHDNSLLGGAYGLDAQGGSDIFFHHNKISLTAAATGNATGVRIRTGVGNISVDKNSYGSSVLVGCQIDAGTGDDIQVTDNRGPSLGTLCVDNRPGKVRSTIRETH